MPGSPRPLALVALVSLVAGCSNDYPAPTPDEPHAVLEFERDYDRSAGLILEERLSVLGQTAFEAQSDVSTLGLPRIDMVLLHPEPTRLEVLAEFVRYEYRLFWETYYAGGQPRTRSVWRRVRLVDARCTGLAWLSPEEGETYVLSFHVDEAGACRTDCWLDPRRGDDPESRTPCPLPTAAEKNELESR